MKIRLAEISDLNEIANVHELCFKGTFISSFGHNLIKKYYEEFFNELPLFVVAEENNQIVGFCMGYKSGSIARRLFIKKNVIALSMRMLYLCICFNSIAISKCMNLLMHKKNHSHEVKRNAEADLLSICILDPFKGKGVSKDLVNKFEELLIEYNLHDYTLSVYKSNYRAISFYNKMGFNIISEADNEFKMYKHL